MQAWFTANAEAFVDRPLRMLREAVRYSRACQRAQFEVLPDATAGVDRIVGAGVQVAGPSVAALHRVPYRYLAYCPALIPSAEHPSMGTPSQTLPRWLNRASWRATRAFFNAVFRRRLAVQRATFGLPPVRDVLEYLLGDRPTLAADEALAPIPADCRLPLRRIPALQPAPGEALPAKLESFLEQGPPPVYLGFGSMADPDPERTTGEMLQSLAEAGCRAIVARGWAGLGGRPLPEGMIEIDSVSTYGSSPASPAWYITEAPARRPRRPALACRRSSCPTSPTSTTGRGASSFSDSGRPRSHAGGSRPPASR